MLSAIAIGTLWALIVSVNIASSEKCEVLARIDTGLLCGRHRTGENGTQYASFRGVPYAKQPLGELRFKELQPLDPWDGVYNASIEKDICPQNTLYCGFMNSYGMSEACIYANIHIPIEALPPVNKTSTSNRSGLPIIVFIHGGGFVCGSGDSDLYGPEYLISRGVIVITFNYRLGFFGFFSLGTQKIPGNNGLRDQVTLLRWVQKNARAFGGNPDNVTLMGQSAGSVAAHLLTLSRATKGLIKRAILMSGVGVRSFFSSSPAYAKDIANQYLAKLGINTTDQNEIHRQLIDIPVDKILKTNSIFEAKYPISVFVPVVESRFPGVTTIVDGDPETLMGKGRGKHIPLIIGFTSSECEIFRFRFETVDILSSLRNDPLWTLTHNTFYTAPKERRLQVVDAIEKRYMNGSVNIDNYVKLSTDYDFIYPALKVAELSAKVGTPVYLYNFSYHSEQSIMAVSLGLNYTGAIHLEDLTYVFRLNYIRSVLGWNDTYIPNNLMHDRMTLYFTNFARCSNPRCNIKDEPEWTPVQDILQYQEIEMPTVYRMVKVNKNEIVMKQFFDKLYENGENSTDVFRVLFQLVSSLVEEILNFLGDY